VLDLRTVCSFAEDYPEASPIEPSFVSGLKIAGRIAGRIADVIANHDFNQRSCCGLVARDETSTAMNADV
jgi:hypothetical protein